MIAIPIIVTLLVFLWFAPESAGRWFARAHIAYLAQLQNIVDGDGKS